MCVRQKEEGGEDNFMYDKMLILGDSGGRVYAILPTIFTTLL